MASSIPTARTDLHAALAALTGTGESLEGVKVVRTGTWKEHKNLELIAVLNARNISRDPMLSSGRRFAEEYTIPVRVVAVEAGDDIESVETRMWALVTVVEQTVLASGTFDSTVVVRADPAGSDEGEESGPTDENHVYAALTLNVSVEARVTLAA